MNRRTTCWMLLGAFCLFSQSAHANDPCFYLLCKGSAVSGGAYPSFADMFNINPASIPIIPTPVGVEVIGTTTGDFASKSNINLALIKGFQRIGSAVTTNNDNTFYNYNLIQAFQGTTSQAAVNKIVATNTVMPTINFGSAIGLAFEEFKQYAIPSLGANLRYNKVTKAWDYGFGASLNAKVLSLGVSTVKMQGSGSLGLPATTMTTVSAGLKFTYVDMEYTALFYGTSDPNLKTLPVFTKPVQIITGSAILGNLSSAVAYRTATNIVGAQVNVLLVSLQYQFNRHLAAAYLHNYVPGSDSIGAQIFF